MHHTSPPGASPPGASPPGASPQTSSAGRARVVRSVALIVLLLAWLPALVAVAVGGLTGAGGWEQLLRLIVTALVYAPVASIVITIRQVAVGSIIASLAVSSGLLSLVAMLRRVASLEPSTSPSIQAALDGAQALAATVMHLSELAALGMLIWLLAAHPWKRFGVALGGAAVLLEAGIAAAVRAGAEIPAAVLLSPLLLALVSFLIGISVTVASWWRGRRVERITLAWFSLGGALMLLSYVQVVPGLPAVSMSLSTAAFVLAQGLLPTAVLGAVFGSTGAVIDRRFATGIVWTQSLASAIGLYLLVDAVALHLGADETLAGGLAAAVLALVFSVMLGVLRGVTGLMFFGPGTSVRRVLARLGDPVSASGEQGGLAGLAGLAEALREVWRLRSVTIRAGLEEAEVASAGSPGGFALSHRFDPGGSGAGTIVCTADDPAVLSNVAAPMLEEIGSLVGVAVQLATANQDLAALRDRTRGVSREERRMLHRELHDELAPSLAGIGFAMVGARRLVATGSPLAGAALDGVQRELAATTERVRRLARALLPAALDAGDLDGALRELALRFSGPACAVSAYAPGTDALESDEQIAVYLVLADAVEILSRERWTSRIRLDVGVEDGAVVARLRTDPARNDLTERARAAIARRCSEAGSEFAENLAAGWATAVIPR